MESGNDPRDPGSEDSSGRRSSTQVAAIAGSVILVGLVAFSLYRRSRPVEESGSVEAAVEESLPGSEGALVRTAVPVELSEFVID